MHVVSLIGEQPIPCLMILRFLKPKGFTLVCSDFTRGVAQRLKKIVKANEKFLIEVSPYQLGEIRQEIFTHVRNLTDKEVTFDLTGGTKVMAFAAYDVARSLRASAYYLRSQRENVLFKYTFSETGVIEERLDVSPDLFTLHDYLSVYLDEFKITGPCKSSPGREFEIAVREAMESTVDEIEAGVRGVGGQLDLDLAFRLGCLVGVAEVKTGKKGDEKDALEQLKSATNPKFLGTFTKPFLIIDHAWGPKQRNLQELAEAWDITVIELPSYREKGNISREDREKLRFKISEILKGG